MVSAYGGIRKDNDIWKPTAIFQEKSGNTLKFQYEGGTEDLKIVVKENGKIIVSSHNCM